MTRLFCVFLLVAGLLAPASWGQGEVAPAYEPLLGLLGSQGIGQEEGIRFVEAIEDLELRGELAGLRAFQADRNELIAMMSGMYLALIEPKRTLRRARSYLERGEGSVKAHLLTVSFVPRRQSVATLLRHWEEVEDEELVRIIKLGLRSLTGRSDATRSEWQQWWKENRRAVELAPLDDLNEALSRLQFATNLSLVDVMKEGLKGLDGKEGSAVGDALGSFFDQMEALNRLGMEAENEFAERGDLHWAEGRGGAARKAYERALQEFSGDVKSEFLLACLELEGKEIKLAQTRFERIASAHERAYAARALAGFCQRFQRDPERPVLDLLLESARSAPDSSFENGWLDDVVMGRILGQAMVKRGIYHRGAERLSEIASEHPEDLAIQIGVAMLMGASERVAQLEGVLARFPGAPLALGRVVQARWRSSRLEPEDQEEMSRLCRRWIESEPANLLPHVLLLLNEECEPIAEGPLGWRLSEQGWEELARKAGALKWNDHWRETVEAQRRVGGLGGYPFPFQMEGFQSAMQWFRLARVARSRVRELHDRGDPAGVAATLALVDRLCDPGVATSLYDLRIMAVCRSAPRSELAELFRKEGRIAEAVELETAEQEARDLGTRLLGVMKVVEAVSLLPVPFLQEELRPLLLLDPTRALELYSPAGK